MRFLYPEIEPYHRFYLDGGAKHRVYVEECGNPSGFPALFLHGGPASGCKPEHRRFFDPRKYRIILFDQRGAGRSLPYGELEENTTWDLVGDMERIRRQLEIERWLLFGGSWGAALALLYAQKYPGRVAGMILRGTFLARRRDLEWFAKEGANRIYPEQWQRLVDSIPPAERGDLIEGICSSLWGDDEPARLWTAREWSAWGGQVSLGNEYQPSEMEAHDTQKMVLQVRMEMHYARNRYFLEEDQILANCGRLCQIPAIILHGRNDLVSPVEAAYSLHLRLPEAEWRVLPASGHVARGEEMIDALVSATDGMAERLIL